MSQETDKVPSLKILCLHGYRQNKDVFKNKLGQFRRNLKHCAEFYFINAPHKVVNVVNENTDGSNNDMDERSWWFTSEDNTYQSKLKTDFCIGLDESLKTVTDTVAQLGPFDGILGFSQGAAFTGLISSLLEKKELSFNINFVIIVAGFKSLYDGHTDLYDRKISIPSLHVIGETDEVISPDRSKALAPVFEKHKILMHPGGHYVPASKDLKKLYIDFLEGFRNM